MGHHQLKATQGSLFGLEKIAIIDLEEYVGFNFKMLEGKAN